MAEKAKKSIPVRAENFIKGLVMMLLVVIIGINVGKVARTLSFVPLYFFGGYIYVLLGLFGFLGLYRLIIGKKLKIKSPVIVFGIISLFIASYFLMTYIMNLNIQFDFNNDLQTSIDLYNANLGTFYERVQILPLGEDILWGTGLVGTLLSSLLHSNIIILGISIIFFVLAAFLILIKPIMFIVEKAREYQPNRNIKEKEEKPKKEKVKIKREPNEKKWSFFRRHKCDEEVVEEEEEKYPEIVPISIEKEPEEKVVPEDEFHVQYGFERNRDVVSSGSDYEQANPYLDETPNRVIKDGSYNEFSILKFDNSEEDFSSKQEDNAFTSGPKFENNHVEEVIEDEKVEVQEEQPVEEEAAPVVEEEEKEEVNPYLDGYHEEEEEVVEESLDQQEDEEEYTNAFEDIKFPDAGTIASRDISSLFEENKEVKATYEEKNELEFGSTAKEEPKKKERVEWIPPSSELLEVYETAQATEINTKAAEDRMILINNILNNFKVGARCTSYTIGSSVTRFNIEYDANVSVKSVDKLVDDISLRLGGVSARFTPIVQGESFSGLEIPNITTTTVSFKEVFESLPSAEKHMLSVGFGKDISGNVVAADFDEFPHLLVAGTTGSGKSIYIHSIIATLIMRVSPDDLKIVLVDPKKVEMTKYRDMPHLLCPIITEASKAKVMMSKLVDEMNDRYEKFALADSCSNIKQYNEYAKEHDIDRMPYIIAFLDEYADLVDTCKDISQPVVSIAQKARAAGIHMLISTQRPSTNVITGVIKGNLPTHVALMTSSYTDSMTIIGEGGAEKLLGKGDMLVQSPLVSRVGVTRLQGCYVQNKEIGRVVGYLKEHYKTEYDPNYMDLVDHSKEQADQMIASGEIEAEVSSADEEKYQSIKEWVMTQQFVSMSKIQRECGVGFNRAGKIFSRLQREGIVSTQQDGATKGCKVLKHGDDDTYDDLIVTSDEVIS